MYRKVKAILGTQRIAFETNFGVNYGVNVNDKISNPLYVNSDKLGIYFGLNPLFVFHDFMLSGKGFQKGQTFARSKTFRLIFDLGLVRSLKLEVHHIQTDT